MRVFFVFLLVTCLLSGSAFAALPASYNGKLNNFSAKVIQQKAVNRGIPSNDPRVVNTYSGVSAVLSGAATAAGLFLSVGSPVRWIQTAAKILAAAGVAYTLYEGFDLLFSDVENQVTVSGPDVGQSETSSPLPDLTGVDQTATTNGTAQSVFANNMANQTVAPQTYTVNSVGTGNFTGSCVYQGDDQLFITCVLGLLAEGKLMQAIQRTSPNSWEVQYMGASTGAPSVESVWYDAGGGVIKRYRKFVFPVVQNYLLCKESSAPFCPAWPSMPSYGDAVALGTVTPTPWTIYVPQNDLCPDGSFLQGGMCVTPSTAPTEPVMIDEAAALVPEAKYHQPVDAGLIAAILNKAMQQAANNPSYAGLPWLASDPITEAEVASVIASDPSSAPTVGDMLSPVAQSTSAGQSVSLPLPDASAPSTSTSPAPEVTVTNPAASQPQINLGGDPNIGAPTLEAIPTPDEILAPLLGLFPALKSFSVPAHSGICPVGEFELWGNSFVIDAHCALFEGMRSVISAVSLLCFALLALFKLLSA
jgi:hypothetical protein